MGNAEGYIKLLTMRIGRLKERGHGGKEVSTGEGDPPIPDPNPPEKLKKNINFV